MGDILPLMLVYCFDKNQSLVKMYQLYSETLYNWDFNRRFLSKQYTILLSVILCFYFTLACHNDESQLSGPFIDFDRVRKKDRNFLVISRRFLMSFLIFTTLDCFCMHNS